jgi:hypothetical protein
MHADLISQYVCYNDLWTTTTVKAHFVCLHLTAVSTHFVAKWKVHKLQALGGVKLLA